MSATRTVSHGWAPPNDARTLTSLLIDDLRRTIEARDFVATLQRSAELSRWTRAAPGPSAILRELTALAEHGPIARLAALESIAAVPDDAADQLLIDALSGSEPLARRHATWHLARRTPHQGAVAGLLRQLVAGGIDTMHAHRTLRRWAETEPAMIKRPAEMALSTGNRLPGTCQDRRSPQRTGPGVVVPKLGRRRRAIIARPSDRADRAGPRPRRCTEPRRTRRHRRRGQPARVTW